MNSLEVFAAVGLLRKSLAGARVEKIFQDDNNDVFALGIFSRTAGKKFLVVMKDFIYLSGSKPLAAGEPPNFCMLLRKHLGNSAITGISQLGFDRIVSLRFSTGQTLVCEIFDGNVILLDGTGTIVAALRKKRWRTRAIFPGERYEPPPGPLDPRTFLEKFAPKNKEIVKVLASDFGLGGNLAEEVCTRAGVEKLTLEPKSGEVAKISETILKLFDESLAGAGFSYSSDTISSPVRLHLSGERSHSTFFEALEAVSRNRSESESKTLAESEMSRIVAKQMELVERQKGLVEKYETDSETFRKAGDELMANLPLGDSIIAKVRKIGWDAADKIPQVRNADRKSGKIVIETGKPS